jgi:hypothetical protein
MKIPPIVRAIRKLRPDAEWAVRGNSYDEIEWLDKKASKPTRQEVEAEIAQIVEG